MDFRQHRSSDSGMVSYKNVSRPAPFAYRSQSLSMTIVPRNQIRGLVCRRSVLFVVFLLFSCTATAANNWTYVPSDVLLINCGSSGKASDPENREWQGDIGSAFLSSLASSNSTVATADSEQPSVPAVPFMTARIFTNPATYSVAVVGERMFLRLYFYPAGYGRYRSVSDAVFDVSAGRYMLLRNFTPSWDVQALKVGYIVREYSLNVSMSSFVNITFTPSTSCPASYAFINGIEIVSMPDIFSSTMPIDLVGSGVPFDVSPSTALETMYRLNVGGAAVSPTDDSGFFRRWEDDSPYIFETSFGLTHVIDPEITLRYPPATPRYIAPDLVYTTQRSLTGVGAINRQSNLTWWLAVDPGFHYLVRLHFCEIQPIYDKTNQRVFSIYINNMTAEEQADVFAWAALLVHNVQQGSGIGVPLYKDYMTTFPNGPEKVDLRIDLHPNEDTKPGYVDALLNGLEIFKLNNQSDGSLAGVKPTLLHVGRSPSGVVSGKRNKHGYHTVAAIIGVVIGGFVLVFVLLLLFCWRRRRPRSRAVGKSCDARLSSRCYHFTFAEIEAATNGFDESSVIGSGGFGKVYRGVISTNKYTGGGGDNSAVTPTSKTRGTVEVAIKRANPSSKQGVQEFVNEIVNLSQLRHKHLVSLVGFCDEQGEMILVYDYMANGTMRQHVCNDSGKPTLGWKRRLEICVGVARGLHYLHTGHGIIHRDIKTTNILLDKEWIPKVADFGLAKVGPDLEQQDTHVTTAVMGTFGYLDPEYCRRMQLTEKSDVYSFGVVLFEALCGRLPLNDRLPPRQKNLANWARHCYENGFIVDIVDQQLSGQIAPECFAKFVEIAYKCVALRRVNRPSMGAVLCILESALKVQNAVEANGSFEAVGVGYIPKIEVSDTTTTNTFSIASTDFDTNSNNGPTQIFKTLTRLIKQLGNPQSHVGAEYARASRSSPSSSMNEPSSTPTGCPSIISSDVAEGSEISSHSRTCLTVR